MRRITIIDGHPDPAPERFVHALADAYATSAEAAGHQLRRLVVAEMDFPLLRSAHDWQEGEPCRVIRRAQGDIAWADHVVLLYPLWLGDVPALLKGFLEQLARPGFAIAQVERGLPAKLLRGRSARVIVTMGMPELFYTLVYRAHSLKSLERNFMRIVGFDPVRHSVIGNVESGDDHRRKWLKRVARLGMEAN
jgi:putative NADPH-quinone reductase